MKKIYKALLSIGLSLMMCFGVITIERSATNKVVVSDAASSDFYSTITAKSGTQLLGQVHDLITSKHTYYTSYSDCKTYGPVTDPGLDGRGALEFYTHETIESFVVNNNPGTWNREHVWAQSLSNGMWGTSGGGSDLHHLRPSEVKLNASRGNNKYGEVTNGTEEYSKNTSGNNSKLGGYSKGSTFMPLENVKGDVARIVMYVYTHYNSYTNSIFEGHATTNGGNGSYFGTLRFTDIMAPSTESAAIELLLEWNKSDPVDQIERTRNEEAFKIQKNRNPFIDHPEYADAIWGNGSITPDPGPGGETTPTLTGLTMSVSSLSLTVGQSSTLSVTATPNGASNEVSWTTSDSSVATVSNGTVNAVGAGTATITATSTKNSSIKATATVTVTSSSTPPAPTGSATISIQSFPTLSSEYDFQSWSSGGIQGTAYIFGKETSKMQFNSSKKSHYLASTTPTPQPIQSVTVTLSSGGDSWKLLTSTSAYGEMKDSNPTTKNDHGAKDVTTDGVTWTLNGDDTYFALVYMDTGASYLESVTVTYGSDSQGGGSSDTLTSLAISPASVALTVGESQTLSVTATPSTASNTVTWSSSNASVATVSNGTVTAVGQGSATITATSTVSPSVMATAQVTVTKAPSIDPDPDTPPTPPVSGNKITINLDSFDLVDGYDYQPWSAGGVSGIAYMYGGTSKFPAEKGMQFNVVSETRLACYLASTTAAPAPIKSITVKAFSETAAKDWKLLTSTSAYDEVAGKPTNGNDHGVKTVTTEGVTWTLSGEDTYFALTYESTSGASYLDSIIIEYGETGGGDVWNGDNVSAQVNAFHEKVAAIVTSGPLTQRLASINEAITAYKALTAEEKAGDAAADVAKLQTAIADYNEAVRAYNEDAQKANGALYGGK